MKRLVAHLAFRRRVFLRAIGSFLATVAIQGHAQSQTRGGVQTQEELTLYTGNYAREAGGGIGCARFDAQTGQLSAARTVAVTANPSFLALSPDGRFLYAVNEWGQVAGENQGGLSAFSVDAATGDLTPLNALAQGGTPCHLTVDATGKWLLVAAYSAGTVSTWRLLDDGRIGERVAVVQQTGSGPNEGRQKESHAHQVVLAPDNRRVFSVNLGGDKVMLDNFDANNGQLSPSNPPFVAVAPGAGPRHVALSPTGEYLYVVSELDNTITVFKDAMKSPQKIEVVPILPTEFKEVSFAAEIVVNPDGKFVYASNRGHNSVVGFSVGDEGQLTLVGFTPTGRNPRHFAFDPSGRWLLVANQSDRSITVFGVDGGSGALTPTQQFKVPDEPTCLVWGRL